MAFRACPGECLGGDPAPRARPPPAEPGDEVASRPGGLVVSHYLASLPARPSVLLAGPVPGVNPLGMRRAVALVVPLVFGVAACGGDDEEPLPTGAAAAGFAFAESAVAEAEAIDPRFTCDGRTSRLTWPGKGAGGYGRASARRRRPRCAPGGTSVHWVAYAIPPGLPGPRRRYSTVPRSPEVSPCAQDRATHRHAATSPVPACRRDHGYVPRDAPWTRRPVSKAGANVDDLTAAIVAT